MALNYYNAFCFSAYEEEYESESEEEDDFETSDIELYPNKQNFQTIFPNQLFGTEKGYGEYFFPGTYDEAALLTTLLGEYKDQESLFDLYVFSDLLVDKIKDWPYGKLTCSVLYYYLNHDIAKNNLNCVDWKMIGNLIQSPAISQDVFSFLKQNNVVNYALKSDHILGFMTSIMFSPFSTYVNYTDPMLDVRVYYRLLRLANIEKSIIRELIKIIITEQDKKAIAFFFDNQYELRELRS